MSSVNQRPLGFLRVWAGIETVAVVAAVAAVAQQNETLGAAAGGMFVVIVSLGSWMSVTDFNLVLAATIALALLASIFHLPWWSGALSANVLLLLANLPQNVAILLSSSATLRRRISKLQ